MVARLDSAMLSRILDVLSQRPADHLVASLVDTALGRWIAELQGREGVIARQLLESRSAAADSQSLQLWRSRWLKGLLSHDPAPFLARIERPVFALIGSLDLQVPPRQSMDRLRQLFAGDRQRFLTTELPRGINHMLQPAATGSMHEYATIETTIGPEVLEALTRWIRSTVPTKAAIDDSSVIKR